MKKSIKQQKRQRRHKRIRARISGTAKTPRLCVFKSNQYIYAQLIDDQKGKIIASAKDSLSIKQAKKVGELIAKKALEKKIAKVVFDRAGYKYHGRVKALAEGAREVGLKF
jgi:large subunit ribosomal protein L18